MVLTRKEYDPFLEKIVEVKILPPTLLHTTPNGIHSIKLNHTMEINERYYFQFVVSTLWDKDVYHKCEIILDKILKENKNSPAVALEIIKIVESEIKRILDLIL